MYKGGWTVSDPYDGRSLNDQRSLRSEEDDGQEPDGTGRHSKNNWKSPIVYDPSKHDRQNCNCFSNRRGIGLLNSVPKRSMIQKKCIYYPEMAKVSKQDALLFEFLKKDFGSPFLGQNTDPDQVDNMHPDFGFNNYLIFDNDNPEQKKQ